MQQDANFNTTALLLEGETAWGVVERYVYDPYGQSSAKLPDWSGTTPDGSYQWRYVHQGGRFDTKSRLYHFRNRDLGK